MYDFNEIKNVGLFIDGENINSKDIEFVIEEVKKFGRLIVNRVYGDWSTTLWNQWKQYCIKEGLEPIHCAKLPKKNSVDIRLIDDIYECLFVNSNIDIYVLASTDADFLTVARKVKRYGKIFITIGYNQCSEILKNVCDKFIAVEMLRAEPTEVEETNFGGEVSSDEYSDNEVDNIVTTSEDHIVDNKKWKDQYDLFLSVFTEKKYLFLSNLRNKIKKKNKNYKNVIGSLTGIDKMLESQFKKEFFIRKKGDPGKSGEKQQVVVYDLSAYNSTKYKYLKEQIDEVFYFLDEKEILLSVLKDKLTMMTNNFDQRIYGYKRFKDFMVDIFSSHYKIRDEKGASFISQIS
jgi:uncharacterized protein (TIGR00288 family)